MNQYTEWRGYWNKRREVERRNGTKDYKLKKIMIKQCEQKKYLKIG